MPLQPIVNLPQDFPRSTVEYPYTSSEYSKEYNAEAFIQLIEAGDSRSLCIFIGEIKLNEESHKIRSQAFSRSFFGIDELKNEVNSQSLVEQCRARVQARFKDRNLLFNARLAYSCFNHFFQWEKLQKNLLSPYLSYVEALSELNHDNLLKLVEPSQGLENYFNFYLYVLIIFLETTPWQAMAMILQVIDFPISDALAQNDFRGFVEYLLTISTIDSATTDCLQQFTSIVAPLERSDILALMKNSIIDKVEKHINKSTKIKKPEKRKSEESHVHAAGSASSGNGPTGLYRKLPTKSEIPMESSDDEAGTVFVGSTTHSASASASTTPARRRISSSPPLLANNNNVMLPQQLQALSEQIKELKTTMSDQQTKLLDLVNGEIATVEERIKMDREEAKKEIVDKIRQMVDKQNNIIAELGNKIPMEISSQNEKIKQQDEKIASQAQQIQQLNMMLSILLAQRYPNFLNNSPTILPSSLWPFFLSGNSVSSAASAASLFTDSLPQQTQRLMHPSLLSSVSSLNSSTFSATAVAPSWTPRALSSSSVQPRQHQSLSVATSQVQTNSGAASGASSTAGFSLLQPPNL